MAGNYLAEVAVKTLLRVYVGRGWPTEQKTLWALLAPDGSLLQEGDSDPSHWPAADDCEAIISGDQTVWQRVRLPEGLPRGEYARVLANALEEKLIEEPDRQHLTVTGRQDGEIGVLVIARKRLRDIVARFASLGRPLSWVYSELQTSPFGIDDWHLAIMGNSAILRRHADDGISLDIGHDGAPPPLLATISASTGGTGNAAPVLTVHAAAESDLPDIGAWATAIGLEVRQGTPYRWLGSTGKHNNLLHGEFVPAHRHRAWLGRIRPALWLVAAAVALDMLLSAIQVGWLRYQLAEYRQQTASMFQSAFPSTPAVAPAVQVKRQLDRLRSPLGLLRTDDALVLLASLADSLDADGRDRIQRLRFEDGALEVTLASTGGVDSAALARQLDIRGFSAMAKTSDDGGTVLIVRGKLK